MDYFIAVALTTFILVDGILVAYFGIKALDEAMNINGIQNPARFIFSVLAIIVLINLLVCVSYKCIKDTKQEPQSNAVEACQE